MNTQYMSEKAAQRVATYREQRHDHLADQALCGRAIGEDRRLEQTQVRDGCVCVCVSRTGSQYAASSRTMISPETPFKDCGEVRVCGWVCFWFKFLREGRGRETECHLFTLYLAVG